MMKLSIVYSWCWYLFKLNVCVCLFDACLIGDACPYLHASEAVSKPVSYVRPLAELPPSDTLSKLAARPKNRAVEDKVSGVGGHVVARVCSDIAVLLFVLLVCAGQGVVGVSVIVVVVVVSSRSARHRCSRHCPTSLCRLVLRSILYRQQQIQSQHWHAQKQWQK